MTNRDTETGRVHSRVGELAMPGTALGEALSREELFEALSNARRRCALYYLQQQDGPVQLGEIVDYVAAWQYDQPVSQLDSQDRMCVYSALHQAHLPKLDDAGFIDYDSEQGLIDTNDRAEYARLYLEYDPGNDIPWSGLYLGLAGIGGLLASLHAVGVYPFGGVSATLLLGMMLAFFGLASLGHVAHEWRNRRAAAELFEIER